MDRAEQAWVDYEYREHPKGLYYTCFVDGYRQAEKNLALTPSDISIIDEICTEMRLHTDWTLKGQDAFYEEVLRRFNEQRQK